ncbi:MAG: hypothetical protein E7314_00715 [Clostridiales bacterium]|nr:hypothetical protein [Clostridiales bacterium]
MKKIFLVILLIGALCCGFIGCGEIKEPEIEKFSITHAEFSNKLGDTMWDDGKKSAVFKVETTEGTMTIPQRSTKVVVVAEDEEIYLEVKTTISNMGVEKEKVTYTLYVPENFIEGYDYQPM